jgi:septal ring factor EnvC (AmiA/AmiB activator)
MLRENGNSRQFNGRADAATIARPASVEDAARRAVSLIGEDSPLRPGAGGSTARPSAEFTASLSSLGEAFQQLRASLQQVEERLEGLQGSVDKTTTGLDHLKDRVSMEDARINAFNQRLISLEAKQGEALGGFGGRVEALTRRVSIALGVTMVLATLAIVALFIIK